MYRSLTTWHIPTYRKIKRKQRCLYMKPFSKFLNSFKLPIVKKKTVKFRK